MTKLKTLSVGKKSFLTSHFFVKASMNMVDGNGLFNNYVTHSGWIGLSVFVMLRDRKQGDEWHFMKGRNVTVKKIINPFFVLL